ncbi:LemA family protein [Coxiella endosymbiont of Amblyomma americanum]|uniref:LemA family protein n=1 Tax=Coxiella endosymbiont of Amblyomma americanum TaxID=325775 RepID=UPI00057E32BA|nr:LemA family protein [Coxiella endosymbiont of Amblyomma americanum]AJC50644.1 LemA family protein [Coxiella endosymbiont of Amblyomma americanum]AUJ58973.1 LemA family protein [Coxiella-like endosymbiont of Amblyomma americanum]
MKFFIVILILLVLLGVYAIAAYNSLIVLIESIRNNNKQIDIQLDRRFKVFESLIDVVKKYMDYERSTLKDVVALRNQAQTAKQEGDNSARMKAENKISMIFSGLRVVFEQYPNLKANQNAMQLQEAIVNTENKLAYAKQAYNDSVERYNAKKNMVFPSIVVRAFPKKLDIHFPYWELSSDKIQNQENYTITL